LNGKRQTIQNCGFEATEIQSRLILERVKYDQQASEDSGSQHRKNLIQSFCQPSFQTNSFSYLEFIFTGSTLL
jgi:hypothetical protein